jgi:hypothetical protein
VDLWQEGKGFILDLTHEYDYELDPERREALVPALSRNERDHFLGACYSLFGSLDHPRAAAAVQFWGHRVHQLVLLCQWFPGWRYDLCDCWLCTCLRQCVPTHQSRCSENQDLHAGHHAKLRFA